MPSRLEREEPLTTRSELWPKLKRSKRYREEFVAQHAKQAVPFQISALLKKFKLTQAELASRAGVTQGVISRAADPSYGNLTLNTLVRIAAGFDVAFVGRFVAFSELPKWFDRLSEESFTVPSFDEEDAVVETEVQAPPVLDETHAPFAADFNAFQQFSATMNNISKSFTDLNAWSSKAHGATLSQGESWLTAFVTGFADAMQTTQNSQGNVINFEQKKAQFEAARGPGGSIAQAEAGAAGAGVVNA